MGFRLALSRLASAEARAAAARTLALLCIGGYVVTMIILVAAGGGRRWFFALLVWTLFVYAPLRILLEAAQTLAPALRRRLMARTPAGADRYGTAPAIELMVDGFFERDVVMPRITTPLQAAKARAGALAVLDRAHGLPGLRDAVAVCLATVDQWVAQIGAWAAREAGQNIQIRWGAVRALAAMTAMTKVLLAAYEDRRGRPSGRDNGPPAAAGQFLDMCLDYCDELALAVDVVSWSEPSLNLPLADGRADEIRAAWTTFADAAPSALEPRNTFVELLLAPPAQTMTHRTGPQ